MGTKLVPHDEELYRRVDEVLHYIWDPIGVAGAPMARDEYDSYLPQIFSMLRSGAVEAELANHLAQISIDRMGLPQNPKRDMDAASVLVDWKETLDEKYA